MSKESIYKYYLTDEDYMLAAAFGVPKKNVYERFYNLGWDKERAIREPVRKQTNIKEAILELYPDLDKRLEEIGIEYQTFCRRLRLGMTIDEALTTPKINPVEAALKKRRTGKITKRHIEIAAKNGIKEGTLKNRVYILKWSIERATTEAINESHWNTKYHPNYGKKGKHEE